MVRPPAYPDAPHLGTRGVNRITSNGLIRRRRREPTDSTRRRDASRRPWGIPCEPDMGAVIAGLSRGERQAPPAASRGRAWRGADRGLSRAGRENRLNERDVDLRD